MKQLRIFLPLLGWDACPLHSPSIKFLGMHLCTWVERGTLRVKCLAQERNITWLILKPPQRQVMVFVHSDSFFIVLLMENWECKLYPNHGFP